MLDETELTRRIQRKNARMPEVDVEIEVSDTDDERARELADTLADAIHEQLDEPRT
mgnify:CR=1 FL=1